MTIRPLPIDFVERFCSSVDRQFTVVKMIGGAGGGVAEWLKAADCKSARIAYAGSNPAPSTICDGKIDPGDQFSTQIVFLSGSRIASLI